MQLPQLNRQLFPTTARPILVTIPGFNILALSFILGSLCGAIIGSFSSGAPIFQESIEVSPGFTDYITLLWDNLRFHFAALFLSTTYLGVFLLPLLAAARGYFITCAASAIICAYPGIGVPLALCALGIPLVVCLPFFLLLCSDGYAHSRRLMSLLRHSAPASTPVHLRIHLIACFLCVSLWTLFQLYLLPPIIAAFI